MAALPVSADQAAVKPNAGSGPGSQTPMRSPAGRGSRPSGRESRLRRPAAPVLPSPPPSQSPRPTPSSHEQQSRGVELSPRGGGAAHQGRGHRRRRRRRRRRARGLPPCLLPEAGLAQRAAAAGPAACGAVGGTRPQPPPPPPHRPLTLLPAPALTAGPPAGLGTGGMATTGAAGTGEGMGQKISRKAGEVRQGQVAATGRAPGPAGPCQCPPAFRCASMQACAASVHPPIRRPACHTRALQAWEGMKEATPGTAEHRATHPASGP